jgi:hypothetical protein
VTAAVMLTYRHAKFTSAWKPNPYSTTAGAAVAALANSNMATNGGATTNPSDRSAEFQSWPLSCALGAVIVCGDPGLCPAVPLTHLIQMHSIDKGTTFSVLRIFLWPVINANMELCHRSG